MNILNSLVPAAETHSVTLLKKAAQLQADRAAEYDQVGGERSMGKVIVAFNAITGQGLMESDGWLIMQLLKDVRDRSGKLPHADSLEDCISYAALKAECRLAGR